MDGDHHTGYDSHHSDTDDTHEGGKSSASESSKPAESSGFSLGGIVAAATGSKQEKEEAVTLPGVSSAPTLLSLNAASSSTLTYAGLSSVSGELLRQCVSELLKVQVLYVHKVLILEGFNNNETFSATEDIPLDAGIEAYLILSQAQLILADIRQLQAHILPTSILTTLMRSNQEYEQAAAKQQQVALQAAATAGEGQTPLAPKLPPKLLAIPFEVVDQLVIDSEREDQFQLVLNDGRAQMNTQNLGYAVPSGMTICSVHRKRVVESIQIAFDMHFMLTSMQPGHPSATFSVITTAATAESTLGKVRKLPITFLETSATFKHPSEQYFSRLPSLYQNGNIYHRCGYMWSSPVTWYDYSSLFLNRPTATYEIVTKEPDRSPPHKRHHIDVHFCPEKPVCPYSNLVKSRDLRGHLPFRQTHGKYTLTELLKGRDECTDSDFFQWAESIARAIAMNETRLEGPREYFIPKSAVYHKKVNVVGDKATWICFQVHIYTPFREICLMAARRKFIPPYFDTFQDIVFVMYGPFAVAENNVVKFTPQPNFCSLLEVIIDTLSPTTVPVPYYLSGDPDMGEVHPTYYDNLLLQARTNALLYNAMSYTWLHTRQWMCSTPMTEKQIALKQKGLGYHRTGIFPRTKFIEMECHELARNFCNSILVKISHRRDRLLWAERMPVAIDGGDGGDSGPAPTASSSNAPVKASEADAAAKAKAAAEEGKRAHQPTVADPMSIVFRMQAEFVDEERRLAGSKKKKSKKDYYTAEEEWKCRLSQYLTFCVDEGMFPGAMSLRKMLTVVSRGNPDAPILSQETSDCLDRVVDFLLFMKKRHGPTLELPSMKGQLYNLLATTTPPSTSSAPSASPFNSHEFISTGNILTKLDDIDLVSNFTCNEHVMIALLETGYIESLERRLMGGNMTVLTSSMPRLIVALLQKDYNSALIRAACEKIIHNQLFDEILITPLMALVKDGTCNTTTYALRALTSMARVHALNIYDVGGVALSMWHIFVNKHEEVVQAALELCIECVTQQYIQAFSQPSFPRELVRLLRLRVGNQRYRSGLLSKAASLLLKLSHVPTVLDVLLTNSAHHELVSIIGQHQHYHPILLEVTAALGTIYVNAGVKMLGTPSETAQEDASTLVTAMAHYTKPDELRLCLNILVVLQYIIKLPWPYYNKLSNTIKGSNSFTAVDKAFEKRIKVLHYLHDKDGLENVLDRTQQASESEVRRADEQLRMTGALEALRQSAGADAEDTETASGGGGSVEQWWKGRKQIAMNVLKKVRWFKQRITLSANVNWNVNALWQADKAKTFLK